MTIRTLFSTRRPIDRPIEKVIDYYATEDRRLLAEVEEYEVTNNVEQNFRRFMDVFGAGVRAGQVTETGIWVSGFYGSGKSSFTKYLGFALDPRRQVAGHAFMDLLAERIGAADVRQELRILSVQQPTAVIMLDLGTEQLASSSTTPVSTVLYWKVLQWAGYSVIEKMAHLEFRLEKEGRLDEFRAAYTARFSGLWEEIHDDPLLGVARADEIITQFFPNEFGERGSFRQLRFSLVGDVRNRAAEILDLVRRKTGCQNVLFLIDEAGQYVAPRGDLILNLDGLARSFKELGQGRVWIVATGQQTLSEIVERAAYNSDELTKLRDRFPISIELDARDIREITWRRLLTKSAAGESNLASLFRRHGQALITHTRLIGTALYRGDPDENIFVRLYPFLPQHFDLLLELVRTLARSTGGIGLRSAIRVIQDLLVDTSRVLPSGIPVLADAPIGRMATIDQFFDTLRADILKEWPHVVSSVERVATLLRDDNLALRVAKAIGALQPIEGFPRNAENVAALLYQRVDDPPNVDDVRDAVRRLLDTREIGLVDDPQAGGFTFLSEGVRPLRRRRDEYRVTSPEMRALRSQIFRGLFDPLPSATIEGAKTLRGGLRIGVVPIAGEDEEIQFRIEIADGSSWEERRTALLTDSTGNAEWKTSVAWLIRPDESVEDVMVEAIKSRNIIRGSAESEVDRDVAQFIRAERRAAETNEEIVQRLYRQALMEGIFVFRGRPTPVSIAGSELADAASKVLRDSASEVFFRFNLVNIRPPTEMAARFLAVERLDRMPTDVDPLGFVANFAGRPRINPNHPALAEALRAFTAKLDDQGTTRLQGSTIQDLFAAPPYGWSKDATRYVFAALLAGGEVVFFADSGEIQTAGPAAIDAVRTTRSFGRIGVSLRDARPSLETLDRAATRLENLLGVQVLPLEDHISRAARENFASRLEAIASLAAKLRLLSLAGVDRAQSVYDVGRSLLQQDGANAIAVLGTMDCTFPDDLRWAEAVAQSLENGATDDIRNVRQIINQLDELGRLFPATVRDLAREAELATVNDVLVSDDFYGRLSDLRSIRRTIRDRASEAYRIGFESYLQELEGIRTRLESRTDWTQVSDEDRIELARRLEPAMPLAPSDGAELSELRTVLFRRVSLSNMETDLISELRRRASLREPENPREVVLDVIELLPTRSLRDANDVAAWLDNLRGHLEEALAAGLPVRLEVR